MRGEVCVYVYAVSRAGEAWQRRDEITGSIEREEEQGSERGWYGLMKSGKLHR